MASSVLFNPPNATVSQQALYIPTASSMQLTQLTQQTNAKTQCNNYHLKEPTHIPRCLCMWGNVEVETIIIAINVKTNFHHDCNFCIKSSPVDIFTKVVNMFFSVIIIIIRIVTDNLSAASSWLFMLELFHKSCRTSVIWWRANNLLTIRESTFQIKKFKMF